MTQEDCKYRKRYRGGFVCELVSDSLTAPCTEPDGICERARQIMGAENRIAPGGGGDFS